MRLRAALVALRSAGTPNQCRLLNVSTDEGYGSARRTRVLGTIAATLNSPYDASDRLLRSFILSPAGADHDCSNNCGPYQHPEQLIPLMVIHAPKGKSVPIHGDCFNIHDWLHLSDHCETLMAIIERGRVGKATFRRFKRRRPFPSWPAASENSCRALISSAIDRPGHDHRFAVEHGLGQTVERYLDHED